LKLHIFTNAAILHLTPSGNVPPHVTAAGRVKMQLSRDHEEKEKVIDMLGKVVICTRA
jgi:hypothetical protein